MKTILIAAPHPDDETLGCGGFLLRQLDRGSRVHWLIATGMRAESGYSRERMAAREAEIDAVADHYGFAGVHRLGFAAGGLDALPMAQLVDAFGSVVRAVRPDTLLVPFAGDIHSDHRVLHAVGAACGKWFRYPSVKRIWAYETPSETNFALGDGVGRFNPNLWVDISPYLEKKLAAMALYSGEMGTFPFPRSTEALRALATLRGSEAGCPAAEGFMVLRELVTGP